MKRIAVTVSLLGALLGCGTERDPQESVTPQSATTIALTPKYRVGESAVYQQNEITRQSQATSLHGVTRVISELRRFRLETRSVDEEGGAVLRLTMEHIAASVSDNGQTIFSFDSDSQDDDGSAQAQARRVLSGLVADVRVAPGGTVVTMAANLTPADLQSVPASARAVLAENWFRAAIETIFRPIGERDTVPLGEPWTKSAPASPPFASDENAFQTSSEVAENSEEMVVILSETTLYTGGQSAPETYRQRTRYRWSLPDGRLVSFDLSEDMTVESTMAGVASAEAARREISLRRVNPTPGNDEEPTTPSADR